MKDELKRVNVVLREEDHGLYKEYVKRKGLNSVSQLIRLAVAREMEEEHNCEQDTFFRRFAEELERSKGKVETIEESIKRIEKVLSSGKKQSLPEKVADDVEELLIKVPRPLTVPEIAELLPQHDDLEIQKALERLYDEFAIDRVEVKGHLPVWKIKGR